MPAEELVARLAEIKTARSERAGRVYIEGYLLKRSGGQEQSAADAGLGLSGMRTSALREKWDKRYFVLKFGRLFYYKDHAAFTAHKEPRGSLNMEGCQLVQKANPNDPSKAKFKLRATEPDQSVRLFTLQCADEGQLQQWLGQLAAVEEAHQQQKREEVEQEEIETAKQTALTAARQQAASVRDTAIDPTANVDDGDGGLGGYGAAAATVSMLEPEPAVAYWSQEQNHGVAADIAMKMAGAHLAELVQWEDRADGLPAVIRQGWLEKAAGNADAVTPGGGKMSVAGSLSGLSGGRMTKRDKRWFVLQHHFLLYFGTQQDFSGHANPKGAIPLKWAKVGHPTPDGAGASFTIEGVYGDGRRVLTLRSKESDDGGRNPHSCRAWSSVLQEHVQQLADFEAAGGGSAAGGDSAAKSGTAAAGGCAAGGGTAADSGVVYCQGWLAKRSGGKKENGVSMGDVRKTWETRWFVLQGEKVSYYKSQQSFLQREKPKASLPIADMTFQREDKQNFKLRAAAIGRVLALEAPSPEDVEMWEQALSARLAEVGAKKQAEVAAVAQLVQEQQKGKSAAQRAAKNMSAEDRAAALHEATSDTTVLREGWMKKETGGKTGASSAAAGFAQMKSVTGAGAEDTRYFVLTPLWLRYFELREDVENEVKPKGIISMAGCAVEQRHKPGKAFKPKFKLVVPSHQGNSRTLSLVAGNKEEMDGWVTAFGVCFCIDVVFIAGVLILAHHLLSFAESAIRRADEKQIHGDHGGNEIAQSLALLKHEGTLLKKAKSKAQPAQSRWFRLKDGVLYYYADAEHDEPINWITLDAQVKTTKLATACGR